MEKIIVIRATDPDGSVFKAIMDALNGKRAEVVDVTNMSTPCCASGNWRSIISTAGCSWQAGKWNSIMGSMPCSTAWPVHQGRCSPKRSSMRPPGGGGISKRDKLRGEYHLAAETETGT